VSSAPEALARARAALARRDVQVLFEDNHLLVLDKPTGLLSQGGQPGTTNLVEIVGAYRQAAEGKPGPGFVGLVHRLDQGASGVMVLAKTSKAAERLSRLLRERSDEIRKEYVAWVAGRPEAEGGTQSDLLLREGGRARRALVGEPGAKEARLTWRVEGRGPDAARVAVRILTGVRHQIRCQMALLGHPLLGDRRYGGPASSRLALHARRLSFPHPIGAEPLAFEAPVPAALRALDRALGIAPALP
jgi:23S rRNA pseudouridine1911/1915/1917 synthase